MHDCVCVMPMSPGNLLHGFDANVTSKFAKGLKGGRIQMFGRDFEIDEKLVVEVTSLSMEGAKFYRDRWLSDAAVKKFPKDDKERKKLAKVSKSNYDTGNIKTVWCFVLTVIMKYITLDGRVTRASGHQLVLLNHFKHKVQISFPFFLQASFNANIKEHKKNPILHGGLLLLIFEHIKSQPSPSL